MGCPGRKGPAFLVLGADVQSLTRRGVIQLPRASRPENRYLNVTGLAARQTTTTTWGASSAAHLCMGARTCGMDMVESE